MTKKQAKVAIVMGSDSDLNVMQEAAKVLEILDVSYELTIVSAHRTPERLFEYAKTAESRGVRVIIGGAGGAAHLPGMLASLTPLPVIGVPIKSKALKGMDSLLSIAQMPPGIPVASMAINGAQNAGILAASIIGVSDEAIRANVSKYKEELRKMVEKKAEKLEDVGFEKYLKEM